MRCMLITTCCESHVVSSNACEEVYFVNGHFTSSSGGCGGLRNPFPKILYASTEPFAAGPYCFHYSSVPRETACSCVGPILVQLLWRGCRNQFGFLFAAHLDSVPVNSKGATGV